jgi:Iron-containing redox enzyme
MSTPNLNARLECAMRTPMGDVGAGSYRDSLTALLDVYALHLAPLEVLQGAEVWQHDPRIARVKGPLEAVFRAHLGDDDRPVDDPVSALRRIARDELVPPVYEWLARTADRDEIAEFLALEGGPDADFDDLIAVCQVGLAGEAKLTLAANYWDEMGRGDAGAVHTELHRDMADALELRAIPVEELPVEALERKALGGLFATNRALQPEMIGGLGLLECQAGPRCRRVVTALRRVGVPRDALPFYEEHATADPRHGKEWIERAVVPLVARWPAWGPRIVQGARWRAAVNRRFFAAMSERFACTVDRAA